MKFLVVSWLLINAVHAYLLITHRANRELTLSERAANSYTAWAIFVGGHMCNGMIFGVFAYHFFLVGEAKPLLFAIASLGIVTEWAQAITPAKDNREKAHIAIAYIMSALMTLLGAASAVLLPLDPGVRTLVIFITFVILWGYPLAVLLPRRYFWVIEMVNINLFYLQMFVVLLVLGG